MALVVTIAGINRTSVTEDGSVYVEQRAADFISVCGLRLVDAGAVLPIAVEQTITLIDGGTTFFSGRVVDVRYILFGECSSRYIDIKCQDDNYKLLETIVTIVEDYPNGAGHAAILSDKQIITDLFNKYSAIVAGGNVATLDANLAISVGPCTLRDAMSQICTRTGGYFYVDFANQLHYFSAEGLGVGWSLSDTPGVPAGSVSYQVEGLDKQSLAMTRLDRVFVIGAGVTGWHPGAGGGRHGIARDNRITTATGITERGVGILAKWGAIQDTFTVTTRQAGLRAGMDVAFKCVVYGEAGATYTVRKMVVKWDGCGIAYYTLTLGAPVNPALKHERNYADGIASVIPILPSLPTSSRGWSHNIIFSAPNNTQINWAAGGVITLADGSTYTIGAGNTGAMGAITYIYLDISIGSPPTTLQVTANAAVAVGAGKLLIAVAQNVADAAKLATFQVFGGAGQGVLVSQGHIAALSVTTNEIAANTILAGNIFAGTITANEIAALTITAAEIAANTITADKIEMGIGDGLYNAADGLLLLGPHCEINTTEWWTARKQKATLSGAFHRETGRWLGTRGLVVEEATTNLITNPSIEVDTTGWAIYNGSTISRDTTYSVFGDASLKIVTDDVGASEGAQSNVSANTAASTEYTLSVYARGSGTVRLAFWDAGGGLQVSGVLTLTDTWTRLEFTATFGVGAVRNIYIFTSQKLDVTYYCDGWQLEAQDYATSYADGTLGTGYAWTGAAHGSTSTRTVTVLNLDDRATLIEDNTEFAIRVVFQVQYDYDGAWPSAGPILWNIREDVNNRFVCYFSVANDRFQLYYIEGGVGQFSYGVGVTFEAGDFIEIVANVDTAGDLDFWINGALRDSDDISALGPIQPTLWDIGSDDAGANQGGFNIVEFAVFDRVLTAIEIQGLYALDRPLVDMGSLDKPGIYILDGRFRIASALTGNRIDITADEIAGYDSGGTKQFYLQSSDGKAYAGAGAVVLDEDGLYLVGTGVAGDTRRVRFLYEQAGTNYLMGRCFGDWGGAGASYAWLQAWCQAGDPWAANGSKVVLAAIDTVAGTDIRITVESSGTVIIGGSLLQVIGGAEFNQALADLDFIIGSDNEANLLRVDAAEDEVRLGDWDTNYSAFEVDGSLRFVGTATVFNDIYIPMTTGKLGGANTPTWAAFQDVTMEYTFAVGDLIHLPSVEIPHSYEEGSDLEVHCHIVTNGSDVGDTDVRYEVVYTIGDMDEVMGAAVGFASLDITIDGGTADRTHYYIFIGTIAGAGFKVGAALKMRFNRKALIGGGNAPTNDPFVLMVGVHVEEDTVGSRTMLAK